MDVKEEEGGVTEAEEEDRSDAALQEYLSRVLLPERKTQPLEQCQVVQAEEDSADVIEDSSIFACYQTL